MNNEKTRYIKFIPSEESAWLRSNHIYSFVLLNLIAERARRTSGHPDGLEIGDAIIGDHEAAGLTRQQYRTAINKLVEFNYIEIVYNGKKFIKREKSTIKVTIKGMIVKLISSTIYDINQEDNNQDINQRPTNSQPTANHKQERIRKNKKIEEASTKTIVGIVHKSLLEVRQLDDSQKQELSAKFSEDVVQRALAHVSSSSFVIKKSFDSALYYYCQHPEQIKESQLDKFKSQQQMQDERLEMIERNRSRCQQFAKFIHGNGRICRLTHNALEVSNFEGDKKMSVYFSSQNVEYEIQQICHTFEVKNG